MRTAVGTARTEPELPIGDETPCASSTTCADNKHFANVGTVARGRCSGDLRNTSPFSQILSYYFDQLNVGTTMSNVSSRVPAGSTSCTNSLCQPRMMPKPRHNPWPFTFLGWYKNKGVPLRHHLAQGTISRVTSNETKLHCAGFSAVGQAKNARRSIYPFQKKNTEI